MPTVSNRVMKVLLSLVLLCGCWGCQKREAYTLSSWLLLLSDELGIVEFDEQSPYFEQINEQHPAYPAAQALVEWGVLSENLVLDPELELTREWVAVTTMNLFDEVPQLVNCKDAGQSKFSTHIQKAVNLGLLPLNERHFVEPKKRVSQEEAMDYVHRIQEKLNRQTFEPKDAKIAIKDTVQQVLGEVEEMDEYSWRSDVMVLPNTVVQKDDKFYVVTSCQQDEDGYFLTVKAAQADEILEEVELEGSFDLDFSQGIFEFDEEVQEEKSDDVAPMSFGGFDKKLKVNGFDVRLRASGTTLLAQISKKDSLGGSYFAETSLRNLSCHIRYKGLSSLVKDAYFRVDFSTVESGGYRHTRYQDLFADLNEVKKEDFISSLLHSFKNKNEMAESIIPIGTVQLPLANMPLCTLTLQLQIHLYASGRAEIVLTQDHSLGFEVKNGKMRMIRDFDHDEKMQLHASGKVKTGLRFGLDIANLKIADIVIDGGLDFLVNPQVHLVQEDGSLATQQVDVSADMAQQAAQNQKDILVCSDVKADMVLDAEFNSSKTFLHKLLLHREINLFKVPILFKEGNHMENGLFMKTCTRKNRKPPKPSNEPIETDKIELKKYSVALEEGEIFQIEFAGLPASLKGQSLNYTSRHPQIASVENGKVTAHHYGSTNIEIEKDGYKASMTVLVKKPLRSS